MIKRFKPQPVNLSVHRALPARFRRPRGLIIGCGDIGLRVVRQLAGRMRLYALSSSLQRLPVLRQAGVTPILGNLDEPRSLKRLAGLAPRILHLAPPGAYAGQDLRTRHLLPRLYRYATPQALVYASTSGVYGDCQGRRIDETQPCHPSTARAQRRVDAEGQLRHWGRMTALRVSLLRVPGIYAPDREGGTPRERLLRGTPALCEADDVYTNHIHADDLACACIAAWWRGRAQRAVNVCDDTELKMGAYFDLAAQLYGLPPPKRITRQQAEAQLSPTLLSFMSESRRLSNLRMKQELRLRLRYPDVSSGLMCSGA